MLSMTLSLATTVFGQENPLERKVSLTVESVKFEDALFLISQTASFNFCYNSNLVPKDSLVSIQAADNSVQTILASLFSDGKEFLPVGNHVVIKQRQTTIPQDNMLGNALISGFVIDDWTGNKVSDVVIFEDYQRKTYQTDSDGRFAIDIPKTIRSVALSLSAPGYFDTTFVIIPSKSQRTIIGLSPVNVISSVPSKPADQIVDDGPLNQNNLLLTEEPVEFNVEESKLKIPLQVSVIPGVGTNGLHRLGVDNFLSMNLFGGMTKGVKGLEIGTLININQMQMYGVQVSGIANIVKGEAIGIQLSGGYNSVSSRVIGLQFGGVANHVKGNVSGWQIAGIYNINQQDFYGFQIATGVNFVSGKAKGFQFSGISNLAIHGDGSGQATWGYNHSGGTTNFQMGLANYSKKLRGIQIGAFNYAKKVNGLQLGWINVSDTLHGVALGMINISKSGYMRVEIEGSEVLHNSIRFKSGTNAFYTIFEGGVRWSSNGFAGYGVGGGIGARAEYAKKRMFSEFDTDVFWMNENQAPNFNLNLIVRFSPTIGVRVAGPLEIHVGPTFIYHHSTLKNPDGTYNSELGLNPFYRNERTEMDLLQQMWVGVKGGIQFNLNWRNPKKKKSD